MSNKANSDREMAEWYSDGLKARVARISGDIARYKETGFAWNLELASLDLMCVKHDIKMLEYVVERLQIKAAANA